METHEHERCRVPYIDGYIKIYVWNEEIEIGKGHGGITIVIKEMWSGVVKLEKEDPNKKIIWLKIIDNEDTFKVASCYFSPKSSTFYKKRNLDNEDPYAAVKKDISVFSNIGEIILIGDFNARTMNNQSIQMSSDMGEDSNPLWLGENKDHLWKRTSRDGNGNMSHYEAELLVLCNLYGTVICIGMKNWLRANSITCKTHNGQSVVDYVIFSQSSISKLLNFNIEICPLEMNSNHMPLFIKFGINTKGIQEEQKHNLRKDHAQGKILLNKENCEIFKAALEKHIQLAKNNIEGKGNKRERERESILVVVF